MESRSIRAIRPDDVAALAAAEVACFPDPWTATGISHMLQDETVYGFLVEVSGCLAGYVLARTIAGEAEVLTLATVPPHRRRGVGKQLLERSLAEAIERGATAVFLEVRESNEAARRLYGAAGFRSVGMRPAYYRRPVENAVVLRYDVARGR